MLRESSKQEFQGIQVQLQRQVKGSSPFEFLGNLLAKIIGERSDLVLVDGYGSSASLHCTLAIFDWRVLVLSNLCELLGTWKEEHNMRKEE